jgi:hypothetical protein
MTKPPPLRTPDGRYLIVRGRLWRTSNPHLKAAEREVLVKALMTARSDVRRGKQKADDTLLRDARKRVHAAKVALGERGSVWWTDGSPDYNRHLVRNSPYADWYERTNPTDTE